MYTCPSPDSPVSRNEMAQQCFKGNPEADVLGPQRAPAVWLLVAEAAVNNRAGPK